MRYRAASKDDLPEIEAILRQSGLPFSDCGDHLGHFVVTEQEGRIVGTGGLEIYGLHALVRSIAVLPECRGKGIGQKILSVLEERAQGEGVTNLHLLTETAQDYFRNLGFSVQDRAATPEAIARTRQFGELCPASATVMCRPIVRG